MPVDIRKLFGSLRLGAQPGRGRLECAKPEAETNLAELHTRLNTFGGVGWVCFTERLWLREQDATLPKDLGPVLSSELYRSCDDTSLHARQDGGGWRVVTITKTGEGTDGSWVIPCAFLRHDWRSAGRAVWAKYEVCWRMEDGMGVYRACASRFVGF